MNTLDVIPMVYQISTGNVVMPSITVTDVDTLTFTFISATAGTYKFVIFA